MEISTFPLSTPPQHQESSKIHAGVILATKGNMSLQHAHSVVVRCLGIDGEDAIVRQHFVVSSRSLYHRVGSIRVGPKLSF